MAMLITLAIAVYRFDVDVYDTDLSRQLQANFVKRSIVDSCVGAAGALSGILLRLPWSLLPISIIGPVAIAEFYQRTSASGGGGGGGGGVKAWASEEDMLSSTASVRQRVSTNKINHILIAVLSALCVTAVVMSYSLETIYYYSFSFHWDGTNIDIKHFVFLILGMTAGAVLIPMLLHDAQSVSDKPAGGVLLGGGVLPLAQSQGEQVPQLLESLTNNAAINTFQMLFSVGSSAVAAIELLIRQQVLCIVYCYIYHLHYAVYFVYVYVHCTCICIYSYTRLYIVIFMYAYIQCTCI